MTVKTPLFIASAKLIGARMKASRKKAGFSQTKLASALGLSQSEISRLETRDVSMSLLRAVQLCRRFRLSPLELLFTSDQAMAERCDCTIYNGRGLLMPPLR